MMASKWLGSVCLAAVSIVTAVSAVAQEVTLRLHHFMPASSTLPAQLVAPWVEEIEAASDGRIVVEVYPSMSLGGAPGDLIDQAIDGAVDIILTLPGYTPGRFNQLEAFELPFMMENSVATSGALYDYVMETLQDDELSDAKILAAWVHGPGVLHTQTPINRLEDIIGMDLRGPTRLATDLFAQLGATPVGMPLPAIPESMSKGVINGAALPWEITPAIKMGELVTNHTEVGAGPALYTATFILAMNWDSYDGLPDDLRATFDKTVEKALSLRAAQVVADADDVGRATYADNNIIVLDEGETARWMEASQAVYERWISRASEKGFDGRATIDRVRELIVANQEQ